MSHWAIAGAGFRGIVAALQLRRAGHAVTLVEGAPFIGGVLHSEEWEGLWLDKGCHLFDNSDDDTTALMLEILGDDAIPVDVHYACITEGIRHEGISIPDFTHLTREERNQVVVDVLERTAQGSDRGAAFETLEDRLAARFGKTILPHLDRASRKMFRAGLKDLSDDALPATFFSYLRIVPDEVAQILKQSASLSDLIAERSHDDPMRFHRERAARYGHRNFYPARRGMRRFCERAAERLRLAGVTLRLGQKIVSIGSARDGIDLVVDGAPLDADRVLWTLEPGLLARAIGGDDVMAPLLHKTPMVLYYFRLPPAQVEPLTYAQNFTEDDLVFRTSAPGIYGRQVADDGMTYICAEIVTDVGSAVWNDPQAHVPLVWAEAVAMGQARGECPSQVKIAKTPVSYRLPKPGFAAAEAGLRHSLSRFGGRVCLAGQSAFGKDDIVSDIRDLLSAEGALASA